MSYLFANRSLRMLGFLGLCFLCNSLCAATRTYQAGGVDTEWYNAGNWSPSGLPDSADILTIDTAGPTTLALVEVNNGGEVLVTGSGATATFDRFDIGSEGQGTLTIENEAIVSGFVSRLGQDVGSLGDATVTGLNSHWDLSGGASVGFGDQSIGSLAVLDQGLLTSTQFLGVGVNAGSSGNLYIEDSTVASTGFIDAGLRGIGLIELAAGASLTSTNTFRVGNLATGVGTVLVDDSTIMVKSLTVGGEGDGSFDASGGSVITATGVNSNDVLRVGDVAGGVGNILLEDSGTLLDVGNQSAQIGNRGEGTVEIVAGAELRSGSGFLGTFDPGSDGSVLVSDVGSQWNLAQTLEVGREGLGLLEILDGGVVAADGGLVGSVASGNGLITIDGAASELDITNLLFVGSNGVGRIEVANGGKISSTTTFVEANGTLAGQGTHVGTLQSRGVVSPGLSAGKLTVEGSYVQLSQATLEIELGGIVAGLEHDALEIILASAQLDGALDLSLINGFVPTGSDTFTILTADSILGSFANAPSGGQVTTTDGTGQFTVYYGAGSPFNVNEVVLADFFFTADVDLDGDVDGADFLAIQLDPNVLELLPIWEASFGSTVSPSVLMGVQVPESSAIVYLVVAILFLPAMRRRQKLEYSGFRRRFTL